MPSVPKNCRDMFASCCRLGCSPGAEGTLPPATLPLIGAHYAAAAAELASKTASKSYTPGDWDAAVHTTPAGREGAERHGSGIGPAGAARSARAESAGRRQGRVRVQVPSAILAISARLVGISM